VLSGHLLREAKSSRSAGRVAEVATTWGGERPGEVARAFVFLHAAARRAKRRAAGYNPPMAFEAVLFDMDGVLVKSEEAWFRTVEAAGVRFRGRPITRAEFTPTFGQGTAADIPAFGLACTAEALDAFYVDEFPRHLAGVWVNPEARPLLEALQASDVHLGLVTNTVSPLAKVILAHAGLVDFFGALATADRVAHAKPAPDLVLLACRELGVAPSRAWFIGDSKFDRGAAQAAGAHFVGLGLDGDLRLERLADFPVPRRAP
jgi:phosphoglycolate phosphatase/AHBA synthesis associated protein